MQWKQVPRSIRAVTVGVGRRWWPTCMFAVWHRAVSLSGKGLVRQNHKGQREA